MDQTVSQPKLSRNLQNFVTAAKDNAESNLILDSQLLHDIFTNSCKGFKDAGPDSIIIVSKLIHAYLFGKSSILDLINKICQDKILIETIQGIDTIIQENKIKNIEGIEKHFNEDIDTIEINNIENGIIREIDYNIPRNINSLS